MSTLPADVARCPGIKDEFGWCEGCESCLRRTCAPTDHPRVSHMSPPEVIVFFCPYYIEDKPRAALEAIERENEALQLDRCPNTGELFGE